MYYIPKAEEIRKRRLSKGLSRNRLSLKAEIGKYGVARMEMGIHKVHPLRAKALAATLGCNVEDIFITGGNKNE